MDFSSAEFSLEDEKDIIQRVLAGAKEEYRTLVLAHQAMIFAIIMREVTDESAAKELTQDTFLKAYLNLSKFRFEANFSTWITRIALNLVNSYFASRKYKQRQKTVQLDLKRYKKVPQETELDRYDDRAIERLEHVVALLRPKLREVFVLCGFQQKSYEEVASILQVPIGTVRSRLNRARLRVRELYFEV